MSTEHGEMPSGPPYLPQIALIGGIPTVHVDVPISAVLLVLFIGSAVGHMTILQLNMRKKHKFILSGVLFGFSMARITTMVMRIVFATRPNNARVAIAAQIFTSAGVLLIFVANLIFAQRMLRAAHPNFGWHIAFSRALLVLYVLIVFTLIMTITTVVQSYYTLNKNTRRIDRDVMLTASTYFLFVCFLPIPMVLLGLVVPRKTRLEKFGSGRWRTKIAVLLSATAILTLGAGFRTGTSFMAPRPKNHPAWYHARWCYYFFNFVVELVVSFLYIVFRIDQRFYVPDGSKQAGDYSGRNKTAANEANLDKDALDRDTSGSQDEDEADAHDASLAGGRPEKDLELQNDQRH